MLTAENDIDIDHEGKKGRKGSGKVKFHNGVWLTLGQLISLHYTSQAED